MIHHLACIMDGNRRWAQKQGLLPWYGHKEGIEAAIRLIDFSLTKKIPFLSLYVFAIQNFKRSLEEIKQLFDMINNNTPQIIATCKERLVKVVCIGNKNLLPDDLVDNLNHIEQATQKGTALQLNLFIAYGGQEEIINACKDFAQDCIAGKQNPANINPEIFKNYLLTQHIPFPDLIIRSGNTHRLSNFLLYQAAYAELYFSELLWPEINTDELEKAYAYFLDCKRNFGS